MALSEQQRHALSERYDKMWALDEELRALAEKAIAIGELHDDDELNGRSYSGIVFNMGRAGEAALLALGAITPEDVDLEVSMFDPDEIIARSDHLIEVATDMIFDLRYLLSKA